MKKMLMNVSLLTLLASTHSLAASTAPFNVQVTGPLLTITTNIPNHVYTNAGIKVNTRGYGVNTNPSAVTPAPTCTMLSNGFCQFSVSATQAATVFINGTSDAYVNVSICLNASGPLSCQSQTFWFVNTV